MSISITPSDRLFVLTGAGISAESGLPTFRASDGLWAGYNVEEICTPEALRRNPALVWDFYSKRRSDCAKVAPSSPAAFFSARRTSTICTSAPAARI
jgi:NAD-dependent deacetylase